MKIMFLVILILLYSVSVYVGPTISSSNSATSTISATTDTSCSLVIVDDATGNLPLKTATVFTCNATTGVITATGFSGALTGNSSTATALAANGANCNAGYSPLGVDASGAVEGCWKPQADMGITAISDSTSTTSSTTAASATAVKSAYDLANGKLTGNCTAGYACVQGAAATMENAVLATDCHAASATILLKPGVCQRLHNSGQAAADIDNTLTAIAADLCFIALASTAQAANYWRFTAAAANTVCLDGTCGKDYVQITNPAVGNYFSCLSDGTNWYCESGRGTVAAGDL